MLQHYFSGEVSELSVAFFRQFARTEYAMKRAGYLRATRNAEADWRKLSVAVEQLISSPASTDLLVAIDYYFASPPKKQIVMAGALEWEDLRLQSSNRAEDLLTYVCRVRNNLFHGGKFNNQVLPPQRDINLLKHGMVILQACVDYVADLKLAYES